MPTKWQRTKVKISDSFKPKDRVAVAEAIIDYIQNRTMDGYDKNLEKFSNYSKQYADIKGVGVSDVDLVLSSDMLTDMKLLSHKKGEIIIGFEKGSEANAKADGNIRGTYGQPKPIAGKARDFLGISEEELNVLIDAIDEEFDPSEIKNMTDDEIEEMAQRAAEELIGGINLE